MILPVQITFRNMEAVPEAEGWVRQEAAKLDTFYKRITSCRVAIEAPHRRHRTANPYRVRIELGVPGEELVVKHEPTPHNSPRQIREIKRTKQLDLQASRKDLHLAITRAFQAATRQLEDYSRRLRGDVKTLVPPPRGRVTQLFPEQGYGFLESADGRQIYFHKQSVLNSRFARLQVGDEVIFAEESGEQGPQASTVKLPRKRLSPGAIPRKRFPQRT